MTGGSRTRRGRGALVLAVAAVLLLAAGAVLATAARPVRTLTASTQASSTGTAPLLLAAPALLRSRSGPVVVRARGDGTVLVAVGRADDVAAWARGAATTTASRLRGDGIATTTAAGDAQVPDPAGSDLWTDQARGTGSAELTVDPADVDAAVLVASDGSGPAPGVLQLSWTDRPVPLAAWGLLGAGALLGAVVVAGLGAGRRGRRVWNRAAPVPVVIDLRDAPPGAAPDTEALDDPDADDAELETAALRRPRGRRRSER